MKTVCPSEMLTTRYQINYLQYENSLPQKVQNSYSGPRTCVCVFASVHVYSILAITEHKN